MDTVPDLASLYSGGGGGGSCVSRHHTVWGASSKGWPEQVTTNHTADGRETDFLIISRVPSPESRCGRGPLEILGKGLSRLLLGLQPPPSTPSPLGVSSSCKDTGHWIWGV